MDTYDQDKNVERERDKEYEYSPDPVVNEALKEASEGKDIEVNLRYGDRELGFKTKKKHVKTWDIQRFTRFIPEHERKYQNVCKLHQIHVKRNKQTGSVAIWNNAVKPGERIGMVQESELVLAMFDLMQYNGVKVYRDKNKQSYRAYIPKHLVKIARLDKQAISPKESLPKSCPQIEPKSENMINSITNNYNHKEVQEAIQRNIGLIRKSKEENGMIGDSRK